MNKTVVKYGISDALGIPNFGTISAVQTAPETPVFTKAEAETFVNVVLGMSEGYLSHLEYDLVSKLAGTPTGDNLSHYSCTVTYTSSTNGFKYRVPILGVKESLLVREGRRTATLSAASIATLKTALETLVGDTMLSDAYVYMGVRQA